jgi:hypothetical protein
VRLRVAAVSATLVVVLAACATTVDETDSSLQVAGETAAPTIPTTTVPITGTAAELLPEIAAELSRLNGQIAAEGDQKAALARIEAIWLVAKPEVEQQRPDLVGVMQTAIDMARNGVVRTRPADADKAYKILADLIDRYNENS